MKLVSGSVLRSSLATRITKFQGVAIVSVPQFLWMVRWHMLGFSAFRIDCNDVTTCTNFLAVANEMPRTMESATNFKKSKCLALRSIEYSTFDPPTELHPESKSLALLTALIERNVDGLKVLEGVPICMLPKALPSLRLDRFIFNDDWPESFENVCCQVLGHHMLVLFSSRHATFAYSSGKPTGHRLERLRSSQQSQPKRFCGRWTS